MNCSAKLSQDSRGEMRLHQSSTAGGGVRRLCALLHVLIVTCCTVCGPALCSRVPALRKKEHGNGYFLLFVWSVAYLFEISRPTDGLWRITRLAALFSLCTVCWWSDAGQGCHMISELPKYGYGILWIMWRHQASWWSYPFIGPHIFCLPYDRRL